MLVKKSTKKRKTTAEHEWLFAYCNLLLECMLLLNSFVFLSFLWEKTDMLCYFFIWTKKKVLKKNIQKLSKTNKNIVFAWQRKQIMFFSLLSLAFYSVSFHYCHYSGTMFFASLFIVAANVIYKSEKMRLHKM